MFCPTYSNAGDAALVKQGQRYALAGEIQRPRGDMESTSVVQMMIKRPGLNDPHCCPSVTDKTLRYQWSPAG
ncbi:hypothetical protein [Pseudoxanthomonas mexicana]|uniref:hypothetical protein n=1 Tax=Pseudoxanthomonas mexicana TaxID=128785 RepID=UPI0012EDF2E2|nr:hypothetical protein [Pseudoxanthomonas mexicana]